MTSFPRKISEYFVPIQQGSFYLVLTVFFLLICWVGVFNLFEMKFSLLLVFLSFFWYMVILFMPVYLYRQKGGWFHPLVFTALWWGLFRDVMPRLAIFANGLEYHRVASFVPGINMDYLVAQSLILSIVGVIAMYAGYICSGNFRVPKLKFDEPRYVKVKVSCVAMISALSLFVLVREAGGIGSLMVQRGMASDMRITAEIGGHWQMLVSLFPTACLVWLAIVPKVWRDPFFYSLFALALLMIYIATGSRSSIVVPLLIAIAIWSLHYRKLPYGKGILVAIVTVFLIGVLGEVRDKSRRVDTVTEIHLESGFIDGIQLGLETITVNKGEFDGFYGILAKVPEEVDFLWGESYLSIPVAPIPRAIWPSKPEAGGKLNAAYIFGNPLSGIPPGNIGEAYWNFHVPGVIIVMLLFGVVLKWFARLYVQNDGAGWVVAVYLFTLFYLQPNSPSFYSWFHAIIPIVLFIIFFQGFPVLSVVRRNMNSPQGDRSRYLQ